MKKIIIAVLALTVSAAAISKPKPATKDTAKIVAFPINETNIGPMLQMVGTFSNLLENVPGLPLTGKQVREYQSTIAQYQQMLKEWEEKKKQKK